MKPTCYAQTDPGNKRPQNEDFYLMDEELSLFVVCDGVGGHASGGLASEMCARTVRQIVAEGRPLLTKYQQDRSLKNRAVVAGLIQKAIQVANEKIHQLAEADISKRGMCTTIASMLLLEDYAILAYVGDSRIYLSRAGTIHQLTEDHKFAVEMVKRGLMKPEEAVRNPQANVLTRAVGIQATVQVDTLQLELMSGDLFLICTDGLHGYTDRAELKARLGGEVQRLPEQLVKYAKDRGGNDNVTAMVIKVDQSRETKNDVLDVMKKTEILGKIPIFRYMAYPEIAKILSVAQVKNFQKGAPIVNEGDASDEMYIIASGTADVLKKGIKVAQRLRGEAFGEMGIFDNAPRSASVFAADPVQALVLNRKDLLSLLRQEAQIAVKLLWALNSELNAKLRHVTENIADQAAGAGKGEAASPEIYEIEEGLPFEVPEITRY